MTRRRTSSSPTRRRAPSAQLPLFDLLRPSHFLDGGGFPGPEYRICTIEICVCRVGKREFTGALRNLRRIGRDKHALLTGYLWLPAESVWINRSKRKVFSFGYVEEHGINRLRAQVRRPAPDGYWDLFFNVHPGAAVVERILRSAASGVPAPESPVEEHSQARRPVRPSS